MNALSLLRMPFSTRAVWPELETSSSTVRSIFWALVVPLSLLPPAMILLVGQHHSNLWPALEKQSWELTALLFFLCELASVFLMGWLIRQVAATWGHRLNYPDTFLLAAIAPIPLWLSSLGLLVDSLLFNSLLSLLALTISCMLIYRGIQALCHVSEDIKAGAITQIVFGAGLILWALLLLLLIS